MQRHRPLFVVLFLISIVGISGHTVCAQFVRQSGQQNPPDYSRSAGATAPPQAPAGNVIGPSNRFRGGLGGNVQSQPGWSPQPLFPTVFGSTVGLHAFPSVTAMPGYGNINQPGLPPNAPTVYPNINNPSGLLNRAANGQLPHGSQGHTRGGGTVVYYVPYVPYYLYPAQNDQSPTASGTSDVTGGGMYYASQETGAATTPPSTSQSLQSTTFVDEPANTGTVYPPSASAATEPAQPSPPQARKAKPVTLLAFRDGLIVGVTDYWLEKFTLIYLRSGLRTEVPLEQLDLPKTVQLNRELGVPLELESR